MCFWHFNCVAFFLFACHFPNSPLFRPLPVISFSSLRLFPPALALLPFSATNDIVLSRPITRPRASFAPSDDCRPISRSSSQKRIHSKFPIPNSQILFLGLQVIWVNSVPQLRSRPGFPSGIREFAHDHMATGMYKRRAQLSAPVATNRGSLLSSLCLSVLSLFVRANRAFLIGDRNCASCTFLTSLISRIETPVAIAAEKGNFFL